MVNLAFVALIVGFGFVTAAVVHNADQAIRGKTQGFAISFYSFRQFLFGFIFCMFVGPYVVLERGVTFWRYGGISSPVFAFCFLVALLWSFCSGILVTQVLMISGILPA